MFPRDFSGLPFSWCLSEVICLPKQGGALWALDQPSPLTFKIPKFMDMLCQVAALIFGVGGVALTALGVMESEKTEKGNRARVLRHRIWKK